MRKRSVLLAGICDFGWGSLGKLRLILDELPSMDIRFFGDASIHGVARKLLGDRHNFVDEGAANVALVINDPAMANGIAAEGAAVVYVDSLPYLWAKDDELPEQRSVANYCAQSFLPERLAVAAPILAWPNVHWIEPIAPQRSPRIGGDGTMINFGGLHSHLAGGSAEAYLDLVLEPLIGGLKEAGEKIAGVCGNLPARHQDWLRNHLPEDAAIGRLSPYDFQDRLLKSDQLISSPGSTTLLQAFSLDLPTHLLPPQNLSQILNAQLFSRPEARVMAWPSLMLDLETVERLRPEGEDAVLTHIYAAIVNAVKNPKARSVVSTMIRRSIDNRPVEGALDTQILELGLNGAAQVARLIRQAMLAPPDGS